MINYGYGVSLSTIRASLAESTFRWRNNSDIYKWCRQYEPLHFEKHMEWIMSLPKREDVRMFAIEDGINFKCVGICGLTGIDKTNGHAEFSLYIGPEFQGQKFGKMALRTLIKYGFNVLRLNHIFGETFEGNPAANMFKSVGFSFDGVRRSYYYREGKYIDAHLYSILSNEVK